MDDGKRCPYTSNVTSIDECPNWRCNIKLCEGTVSVWCRDGIDGAVISPTATAPELPSPGRTGTDGAQRPRRRHLGWSPSRSTHRTGPDLGVITYPQGSAFLRVGWPRLATRAHVSVSRARLAG